MENLKEIIARAKTKTPCALNYQCLLADLIGLEAALKTQEAEEAREMSYPITLVANESHGGGEEARTSREEALRELVAKWRKVSDRDERSLNKTNAENEPEWSTELETQMRDLRMVADELLSILDAPKTHAKDGEK